MESILFSPIFLNLPQCVQQFLRRKLHGLEGRYRNICEIEPDSYDDKMLLPHHLNKIIKDKCGEIHQKRDDQPTLRSIQNAISRLERQNESLQKVIAKLAHLQDAESDTRLLSFDEASCSSLAMDSDNVDSSPSKHLLKRESQLSVSSSVLAKIKETDAEDAN